MSDWVYCSECGEEYDRFRGHECDPGTLAELEAEAKADEEVRQKGDDKQK